MHKLVLIFSLLLLSATSHAAPIYYGNTVGDPKSPVNGAGYYLWSNKKQNKWNIRWISHESDKNRVKWFGSIVFSNSELRANKTRLYNFESNDLFNIEKNIALGGNPNVDIFEWSSITRTANGDIDGFEFRIKNNYEILEFNLGSSLFNRINKETDHPYAGSAGIYIGRNAESPDVLISRNTAISSNPNKGFEKSFNIAVNVPEPGQIALLCMGFLALFGVRHRMA